MKSPSFLRMVLRDTEQDRDGLFSFTSLDGVSLFCCSVGALRVRDSAFVAGYM
jgi:hypothetical protein